MSQTNPVHHRHQLGERHGVLASWWLDWLRDSVSSWRYWQTGQMGWMDIGHGRRVGFGVGRCGSHPVREICSCGRLLVSCVIFEPGGCVPACARACVPGKRRGSNLIASSVPAWVICRVMTSAKPQMSLAPGTAASRFQRVDLLLTIRIAAETPPHKANHMQRLAQPRSIPSSLHTPIIAPNEPR